MTTKKPESATVSVAGSLTVSWAAANARRLARQGLAAPSDGGPAAVTGAMAGAHAQVLSAAELSVALRLDGGGTREAVRAALWTDGSLVKTFGRGAPFICCRRPICRCGPVRSPRSPPGATPCPRGCG